MQIHMRISNEAKANLDRVSQATGVKKHVIVSHLLRRLSVRQLVRLIGRDGVAIEGMKCSPEQSRK